MREKRPIHVTAEEVELVLDEAVASGVMSKAARDTIIVGKPEIGSVDPHDLEMSPQEALRASWRKADRARRARLNAIPEPMPWTDPDTAHRALGPGHGGRPVKRSGDES